jgi:hypothetical protein
MTKPSDELADRATATLLCVAVGVDTVTLCCGDDVLLTVVLPPPKTVWLDVDDWPKSVVVVESTK